MSATSYGKVVLVGLAFLFVVGQGYMMVLRATKAFKQTDLTVYLTAAESVLRGGEDLYQITNERGWNYVYPPLFAVVMVPFATLSLFWAAVTWYVLSVVLAAWAVRMSVAMVREEWSDAGGWLLYVLPPCLVGWPLVSALGRGQATVLLLWLVVAALSYYWKGREIIGAAFLAGAVMLKVFPAILLAYFVWRRRWRFLVATLMGIALGAFVLPAAALGWQRNLLLLQEWVRVVAGPALSVGSAGGTTHIYSQLLDPILSRNQSLQAVLWRLIGSPAGPIVAAVIAVGMMAAMMVVGRKRHAQGELLIVCAAFAWMLVIPPVSENHYFILLLTPLAALVCLAARETDAVMRWFACASLALFATLTLVGKAMMFYGPLCWGTILLWAALLTAARRAPTLAAGHPNPMPPLSGAATR
jgi:hypothetical protein